MKNFRALIGTIAMTGSVIACGRSTPPEADAWVMLAQTSTITAWLDTAHVIRLSDTSTRVHYQFRYTVPAPLPGDTSGQRMTANEAEIDVNCARQLVRSVSLTVEMVDSTKASSLTPDAKWQGFVEHPFGSGLFIATCRSIGAPVRQDGT